jgi:hypothetical protein
MDEQHSLYEELLKTIKFRDDLRRHGIIDTGLFLDENDRLYRNRAPEGLERHTFVKIRKGNFTIEGIVPEGRTNMIDLIKKDGLEVYIGGTYG